MDQAKPFRNEVQRGRSIPGGQTTRVVNYTLLMSWITGSLLVRFWLFSHLPVGLWPGAVVLVTAAGAFWFSWHAIAHRGSNSFSQMAALASIGALIGYLLIPVSVRQGLLGKASSLILAILAVTAGILLVARAASGRARNPDVSLRKAFEETLPPGLVFIAGREIEILGSSLFRWCKKKVAEPARAFSYHQNGIDAPICWAILFGSVLEACVTHLLVSHWSARWAWIASELGGLGVLYVFGLAKSLYIKPIELHPDRLLLRRGALRELDLQLHDITAVSASGGAPQSPVVRMWLFEPPNVAVRLRPGSFGQELAGGSHVAFHVDDPAEFLHAAQHALAAHREEQASG